MIHAPGMPTPEQAAALQAVHLDMHFAPHGLPEDNGTFGTYVAYVTETDYDAALQSQAGLDPARGDVFAPENFGYRRSDEEAGPFFDFVAYRLSLSRIADRGVSASDPAALLQEGRHVRAIGTIDYAIGHAMLRSVPIRYADATEAQRLELMQRYSVADSRELEDIAPYRRERNGLIVSRLGDIALETASQAPPTGRTPAIGTLHGLGHATPVRNIMRGAGVKPKVTRHSIVTGNSLASRFLDQQARDSIGASLYLKELDRLYAIAKERGRA